SLRVLPSLDATMKSLPLCEHFVTTCDPPVDNPGLSMTVRVVSPSGTAPSRPFGRPTYGVLAPWRRAGPGSAPRRGAPSRSPGPSTRPGSPGSDPPAGGARQVTTRLSRRPGAGGETAVSHSAPTTRPSDQSADAAAGAAGDERRTFVIDTSVLLSDPRALLRFAEHDVVLPIVVITELEAKRHHPELGFFARNALRLLDELRVQHGGLDAPIPVGDLGGTLRVELNHVAPEVLTAGFRLADNDSRILAVAANLGAEGHAVTVVSKDLPMRVKASAVGLAAEEYRHELAVDTGWSGMAQIDIAAEQM